MVSYTVYFDTETGGVMPKDPTIQLAAVAVDDDTLLEVSSFECKIAFNEADADPEALRINHYSAAAWAAAKSPSVVAGLFALWLKPYSSVQMMSKRTGKPYNVAKLAGYNALTFDLPRLRAMFGESFFPCSYMVRDVLQRMMFYFDENPLLAKPENMRLSTVCQYFNVTIDGAHDALADARMAASLITRMRA